jgi:autotransporter passenger strand-loop-strand repeat protein
MATIFWTLTFSDNWTVPGDWSTGTVPGAGDDAVLGITGFAIAQVYTVTVNTSIDVNSITISDTGAELLVASPGTMSVATNISNVGNVDVQNGGALTVSGNFTNTSAPAGSGVVNIDSGGNQGGSTVTIDGTLTNSTTVNIGNGQLSATTTVSVGAFDNTQTFNLTGNSNTAAILDVTGAAPSTLTGFNYLSGDALWEYGSGSIQSIAAGALLELSGDARIADAGNTTTSSALSGLTSIGAEPFNNPSLQLTNGADLSLSGDLSNAGVINIDTGGPGGSTFGIAGTLSNTNTVNVGNPSLSESSSLNVGNLVNTGTLNITGNSTATPTNQATVTVAAVAPTTLTGFNNLSGNAVLEYASGKITSIAAGADLVLVGDARVADASDTTTSSALTGLTSIGAAPFNAQSLVLINGAVVGISGDLSNSGAIGVDYGDGQGGSTLTIGGTLTSTGSLNIGTGNGFSTAGTTVNLGNFINNGTLNLDGDGSGGTFQSSLIIGSAAPTTLTGFNNLSGDALMEFTTGSIQTIGAGADLVLVGDARVADASDTTTNSALTGLTSIGTAAFNAPSLVLSNGAVVGISGDLSNAGVLDVDSGDNNGGSTFTVAGTLTNTASFNIGTGNGFEPAPTAVSLGNLNNTGTLNLNGGVGGGANQSTLDVLAAAPTTLAGFNNLSGDALLEYASGKITSIAAGADLTINGPLARVADASDTTTSSALTGLTSIGAAAFNAPSLVLSNGAVVGISGDLSNAGVLDVDSGDNNGGSTFTVAGTLTNTASFNIGTGNGFEPAPTAVSLGNLNNTGTLNLNGGVGSGANQSTLDVLAAATTTLTGFNNLSGDALLEYASGKITSIAAGADLTINGPLARVADASDTTTSSALTGLTSIGAAAFNAPSLVLSNGAVVGISGDLSNAGVLDVDSGDNNGGSTFTVAGTLTNTASFNIGTGNGFEPAPTLVSLGNLNNTSTLNLNGGVGSGADPSTLDVLAAAPTTLTGSNNLSGDALLEYASGEITNIGAGAELTLNGPDALVANASDTTTNSALTGLTGIAATAALNLFNGTVVGISGDLSNAGTLGVDAGDSTGGSTLTIDGTLTNTSVLSIGTGNGFSPAPTVVGLGGLDNTGNVSVRGSSNAATSLDVNGSVTDSNAITLGVFTQMGVAGNFTESGTLDVAGTLDEAAGLEVTGTGTLNMQGGSIITPASGTLTADASAAVFGNGTIGVAVTNDTTITASGGLLDITSAVTGAGQLGITTASELELGGATSEGVSFNDDVGTLKLDSPASFSGAINGLVLGDTIDLAGIQATSAVVNGSTLTVTAGAQTFNYQVSGPGLAGNVFALEDDQQGGTDLTLGTPGPVISGPDTQTAFLDFPSVLGPLTIADPNAATGMLTVMITAGSGTLAGLDISGNALPGSGGNQLVLTGTLADVNTMLASVLYLGASAGATDHVQVVVTDASNDTSAHTVAVTTDTVPFTTGSINVPSDEIAILGELTTYSGISVSDPYAQSTGQQTTLSTASSSASVTFEATGGSGGTVVGQGTNNIEIVGTPAQINSYLADGEGILSLAGKIAGIGLLLGAIKKGLINDVIAPFIKENYDYDIQQGQQWAQIAAGWFQLYAQFHDPLDLQLAVHDLALSTQYYSDAYTIQKIAKDFDISFGFIRTTDGSLYSSDAAGEFIYARSPVPGDSFQIQVRSQPMGASSSVGEITQIAVALGSDRVTFGVGRASAVWVNGAAATIDPATGLTLSGGQVAQSGPDTYVVTANTGEVLTVVDQGSYLDLSLAAGLVQGLVGSGAGQTNDFMLPDGTILPQPLTTTELAEFENAWRVTQAASLFDYGPGQSTATFTDTSFPKDSMTLADLPSNLVAVAAQSVAATGITDPGIAAAMEFDYIATGDDPSVLALDRSLFQGLASTPTAVTPSSPPPVVLGVAAPVSSVPVAQSGATAVAFDVYLTGAETTDTEVDYQVIAPNANDLGSAAFGGALPSGKITIAAGQTTGTITVDVPQGALGSLPSADVAVQVSTPSGVPIFAPNSVEAVTAANAVAPSSNGSAPALPSLEYLGNVGSFSQVGNSYTLDLGGIQFGQPLPAFQFAVSNAAGTPGDNLSGSFTWPTVAGFNVSVDGNTASGASLISPITAGSSDQRLTVTIVQEKFGAQSETITFNPVDTNASGYSSPLTPITLTIADTLQVPGNIYSQAWGDVHIVTYNGTQYDFQGAGEFTLAQSLIPNDSFDIQLRLQPYTDTASVTFITQVAISLGSDRVTFGVQGPDRPGTVLVDGNTTTLSMSDPTLTLAGGTVTEISPTMYKVVWNTGETMTVTDKGYYFNVSDSVPSAEQGSVQGLQGEDEGQQNDFQLPDGQVLPQPLTSCELYGEYANAWRVTQATSLFDYGPGQSTATFTVPNFPLNQISLADLPQSVLNQAAAAVAAAGITDPASVASAELDYIATGDPSVLSSGANVNQQVTSTTAPTVTPCTAPVTAIGVMANAIEVTEAASGVTAVTFTAYLTGTEASDTTVDYTVTSPGAGFFGASAFGGALPSSSVVIVAGQTTAQITIDLPQGALGANPDENLQVQVSTPGALPIFAPTAQTEVVSDQPTAGNPAAPVLAYLGNVGTFTFNAGTNTYTLNLGNLTQGAAVVAAEFAVVNAATAPSDNLGGTFTPPTGKGFIVTGDNLPSPLAAGGVYQGLYASINTAGLGANTMSLTFDPTDVNDSGYSKALTPITLDIVDSVIPAAKPQVNTPTQIIFQNVHVGGIDSQHVSVTNTAKAGAANLDVTLTASGDAIANGTITGLAPQMTDAGDLTVGLDTSTAGALGGSVTENFSDDLGSGNTSSIAEADPYIDVFGSAYRLADPSIAPTALTVHVGDPGTQTITITNLDPNDTYSENLIATVVGTTGAVTASGTTGEIVAQADGTIAVHFSTAIAGSIGAVTLDLKSDGTAIDGLGVSDLGDVTIPVIVTADAVPAAAQFEEVSGGGTFTQHGAAYTLDLGTITSATTVNLGVLNGATTPADELGGSFTISGDSEFATSGFDAFSGIASGAADTAPGVTLFTGVAGTFTETITLTPSDTTTSATLPTETLTITGTVKTATPPVISAPSAVTIQQSQASPVGPVSITDPDTGATISATLFDNNGLLAANTNVTSGGGTITGTGTPFLTIVGTLSQVNADLTTLTDADSILGSDTITVDASDSVGGVATPATISAGLTPALSITETVTSVTDTNQDGVTDAGDVINYGVTVTNSGGVTLTNLAVTDPTLGTTLATGVTLSANTSETFVTSYTVGTPVGGGQVLTISAGQTSAGIGVTFGNAVTVQSGGTTDSFTLSNGGSEVLQPGGAASGTTVSGGGIQYDDGTASSTTLAGSSKMPFVNSVTATSDQVGPENASASTFVTLTATQVVFGSAATTTIDSGGIQNVAAGGTASGTTVSSGGIQYDAGIAISTTLSGGTQVVFSSAATTTINGGGIQDVVSGGTASGTTVSSGGTQYVAGAASSTTLSGGTQNVESGGTASGTAVSGGGIQYDDGTAGGTTLFDSIQVVFASAATTTVGSGSTQDVLAGGTASGTTVSSDGIQYDAGITSSTTLSGGIQVVFASAAATTIDNGGTQNVVSGGTASGTTVSSGGIQYDAGTASSTTLSGGTQVVFASATGTTVSGGGTQVVLGSVASTTIDSGGVQDVGSGGMASGTMVSSGAIQYDAGTASGTTLSGGATQVVFGSAAGTTIDSGSTQDVVSGGVASGTTVSGGAFQYDAGTASNTTLSGGTIEVFSGATINGATLSGGLLELQNGATAGTSTITFAGGGTLKLDATGADGFLVAGFAVPDEFDLSDVNFASATKQYVGNTSSGTLTVGDGTNSVSLLLLGNYTAASFSLGAETGGTGTVVTETMPSNGSELGAALMKPS